MARKKICIVITARSSYARIKSVLRELKKKDSAEVFLIAAASLLDPKYGEAANFIETDGFRIDRRVRMLVEGSMAKTVSAGIAGLATIFENYTPDMVVSIADRYETISTAISAAYQNIPLAHIQGGEISGSIDEKVRHAVTKFASLHLVANKFAAGRIRQMGESDDSIFVTGCPSIDLAKEVAEKREALSNEYFYSKYAGVGEKINIDDPFVVIDQHPVTTEYAYAYEQMEQTIITVYEKNIPAIVFWPNADMGSDMTAKAMRVFREKYQPRNFYFLTNVLPEDFLALLLKSNCIIGNSSVGIRECSFLGVPAVNVGTRECGRERGKNVVDADYSKEEIKKALDFQLSFSGRYPQDTLYGDGTAGSQIADILVNSNPRVEKKFVTWKDS